MCFQQWSQRYWLKIEIEQLLKTYFNSPVTRCLCLMKWPSEMFQNLPYVWNYQNQHVINWKIISWILFSKNMATLRSILLVCTSISRIFVFIYRKIWSVVWARMRWWNSNKCLGMYQSIWLVLFTSVNMMCWWMIG